MRLAQRTPYGFVTWNHGVHAEAMNGTEFADVMRRRGRVVSVEDELPLTAPGNLVISWRPAPPKKRKRSALRTLPLRLRFYAPSLGRLTAAAFVVPIARRLPLKRDADVSALWSGCRGGSARTDLALQDWRGSGPRQQVATYEQLAFDAQQRGLEVPSFLTFALASYRQEGTTKQVPSPQAVQRAVREGSPLLCAALQDVEGNMAGEGKLLNIYWLLRRTIDRNVPGAVAELGSNQCINQIVASTPST